MADPTVVIDLQPHATADFDFGLSIPPLDDAFLIGDSGDNHNYDVMLEDLDFDFSFDNLGLPSSDIDGLLSDPIYNPTRLENSYLADQVNDRLESDSGLASFGPGLVACVDQCHRNHSSSGSGVLNYDSPGVESNRIYGDLKVPSSKSNGSDREISESSGGDAKGLDCPTPESQGSGNCGSNVSEDSQTCSRYVNSLRNFRTISVGAENVHQKMKFLGSADNSFDHSRLKRKKNSDVLVNDGNLESRIDKFRKSECNVDNEYNSSNISEPQDNKEIKKARLIRNRESAQLSRQRKKQYVEELEDKVRAMRSTIQDLNAKISYFMAENMTLRQQMVAGSASGYGAVPTPQMAPHYSGMFSHPAVMYPWMPSCPPYMMRQHGSQVPLVPIPRLKPRQPAQVVSKVGKKVESKKNEGPKTKKVSGVSFLGLLFFLMLFGCLVPMVNERYGGVREAIYGEKSYFGDGYSENRRGRLLMVNESEHGEKYEGSELNSNKGVQHCQRNHDSGGELRADQFVHLCNGSEPLTASLYVPRNDKLVKIDGNLIIHSFLASEKAMISDGKEGGENHLAVRGVLAPAIPVLDVGMSGARLPHLRALGSGSADKDNLKSNANDGSLQQWFREGLSGPLLSSGMCTEVFQFDVLSASASGAIVTATAPRNITEEGNMNSTHVGKGRNRNRRILHGHPIPLHRSTNKISEEHDVRNPRNEKLNRNNTSSSVVVSVLVDPREANDADGLMGPKTLSRIFVVILIDSVKYVTYSCILPFKGSASQLVTK